MRKTLTRATTLGIALLLAASAASAGSPAADEPQSPPEDAPLAEESTSVDAEEDLPEAEPEEEIPPIVLKGRELLDELAAGRERIDVLNEEIEGAAGEDLLILDRQIAETKIDYLLAIEQLANNLKAQEEKGLDPAEVREVLENDLSLLGPAIVQHLDASVAKLRALRLKRSATAPADLSDLEQAIAREVDWLQSLFQAYSNQVAQMAMLGMDNATLAEDLANRLANRADRLLGRTQLVDEQLAQLKDRSSKAPEDKSLLAEIEIAGTRKETVIAALSHIVDLMDASALDSSQYRQFLIRTTGTVTVDVFRTGVMRSLLDEWTEELREEARESGPEILAKLVLFLVILLVFRLLAALSGRLAAGAMTRSNANISQLQRSMLLSLASRGVMIIGILVGLSQLGIELGPLLAGLGIAGFIVGFALQDSLANFASGVMILAYRPFDVDDFIEAGGVAGKVSYMSLVSTTILTFDNQTLIVPNSKIWGDVIKNITHQKERRVDMSFHVSYRDDMERAERLFHAICAEHPKVLSDPEPLIRLHKLGKSSIEFAVRPWVETVDYWQVYWDVTREVRRRFVSEGLSTPLPQSEIRIHPTERASQ